MNAWRGLQQQFQAAVLAATDAPQRGPWHGPPGAGIAVYRHACRARLLEVLALEFPKLAAWLGPAAFERIANAYVDAHPSRRPSVRDFGAAFPAFLARQGTLAEAARCAALARFEWLLGVVFDAPDGKPLTPEALAALPAPAWPELRPGLLPAVRRCRCDPGVVSLWQQLDAGAIEAGLPVRAPAQSYVIWRSGTRVHYRALAAEEAMALRLLGRRRRSLAAFCSDLARLLPGAPPAATAARLLRCFATLGLLGT